MTQAIRNLLMDLEDAGSLARARFLIRGRDAKYPALIDEILSTAGITTVLPLPCRRGTLASPAAAP